MTFFDAPSLDGICVYEMPSVIEARYWMIREEQQERPKAGHERSARKEV